MVCHDQPMRHLGDDHALFNDENAATKHSPNSVGNNLADVDTPRAPAGNLAVDRVVMDAISGRPKPDRYNHPNDRQRDSWVGDRNHT